MKKVRHFVAVGLACILAAQLLWLATFIRTAAQAADLSDGSYDASRKLSSLRRKLDHFAIPTYLQVQTTRGRHPSPPKGIIEVQPTSIPTEDLITRAPSRLERKVHAVKTAAPSLRPTTSPVGEGVKKVDSKTHAGRRKFLHVEGDILRDSIHRRTDRSPAELRQLTDASKCPRTLVHLAKAAVVVLAYNRPEMLQATLEAVSSSRLSSSIAKYISQDGLDESTRMVAQSANGFTLLQHPRTLADNLGPDNSETPSTMYVAAHYKWVLDKLFIEKGHSFVIILEDDLKVSRDFFEFFEMLAPLLEADPTLWCISSWNDNGFKHFETPRDALFRSSYFPGLGWMLRRDLWVDELSARFPEDNWDHWMRATTTSRNRECISPFLSRNYNIGVGGATSSQEFYQQFLEPIAFEASNPPRGLGDLSYLLNDQYFSHMQKKISGSGQKVPSDWQMISPAEIRGLDVVNFPSGRTTVVPFVKEEFEALAAALQIHPSPRSSYRRVIWLKYNAGDIFLVDRRLSPFAPEGQRLRVHDSLKVVPAEDAGMSCDAVCRAHPAEADGYNWYCQADQFEFINDCQVLEEFFGCRNGCTQGWGEDIPNMEVDGVGHTPRCLATEMTPTCAASFSFTKRLCPCIPSGKRVRKAKDPDPLVVSPLVQTPPQNDNDSNFAVVPSPAMGKSCAEVCSEYLPSPSAVPGSFECYADGFAVVNDCVLLKKHFACSSCDVNWGPDIPNFVADSSDGNYKRCLITRDLKAATCDGRHAHTRRLCPCQRKSRELIFGESPASRRR